MRINWLTKYIVRDAPYNDKGRGVVVFLDESGDLSFKKGGSQWFVVGGVVTRDVRGVDRVVRKVFRGFSKKGMRKRKGVILHANNETDRTRRKIFRSFAEHVESKPVVVVVEKKGVSLRSQENVHTLYGDMVIQLIKAILEMNPDAVSQKLTVVASRRETNKHLNQMFCKQIQKWGSQECGVVIDVVITPPFRERGLQIADAIVWAVFQKHECKDGQWCEFFKSDLKEKFWR